MKTKEKKELFQKTKEELMTYLLEMKNDLLKARLEHARKKLANTRSLFVIRKKIAILYTLIQGKDQSL